MNKLLIFGLVLCFTGTASAATVTITAVVNQYSPGLAGWDADPNTNYVVIHLDVPPNTTLAGLDICIKTPSGATATDDVVMRNIGVPPVYLPAGIDLLSEFDYTDDRESWLNDGVFPFVLSGDNPHVPGVVADGIIAHSGNPANGFAYIFDDDSASGFAYISGGNPNGIGPGRHILGAIGYDGIDNVSLIHGLIGAFSPGPGGIGNANDTVVWRLGPDPNHPQTCAEVWSMGYGMLTDLDQSCKVDWGDFAIFADPWMWPAPECCGNPADFDNSCCSGGSVDWGDFAIFAGTWLDCNDPEKLPPCVPNW